MRSKAVFFVEFLQNNFRYISVLGNQKHFLNNSFQMKSPFDAQKHSKHWVSWVFLLDFDVILCVYQTGIIYMA